MLDYTHIHRCYNLHVDPDLGVRTAVLRQISCACAGCKEYWEPGVQPKDQPYFEQNQVCKYWKFFKGQNDCFIVKTVPRKDVNPLDIEQAQKEVLGGIMTRMAEVIEDKI
jgi:hypothetical protein